jgi:RNA recognition motif-containing protein
MVMDMNNDVELGVEELSDYEEDQYDDGKAKTQCKGFAFAEFNDPELMYECLKLHHTDLNGRRINVIRSAGGGKEARKEKFKERAKEQDEYISATVDKIFKDYIDRGDLQEGELDNGAVLICKRRSAAIVEAALSEYIEQKADKDLENPSSFFMRIVCNVTEDGEAGTQSYIQKKKKQNEASDKTRSKKPRFERGGDSKPISKGGSFLGGSSLLAKAGVDMSLSEKGGQKSMSSIFPSMSRGRGRGRGGYM